MRVALRVVAGTLKGRKIHCLLGPGVRPTPQRVREAFFSILGQDIPERTFVDVFACSGIMGLEALSRGAPQALFVEKDPGLASGIEKSLRAFDLAGRARIFRSDVYRWVEHWQPPREPVNVFLSPPFADLARRTGDLVRVVQTLEEKVAPASLMIIQGEIKSPLESEHLFETWERRTYGRNVLLLREKVSD